MSITTAQNPITDQTSERLNRLIDDMTQLSNILTSKLSTILSDAEIAKPPMTETVESCQLHVLIHNIEIRLARLYDLAESIRL